MKYLLTLLVIAATLQVNAQNFLTKSAQLRFYSSTPMEDIEAKSNQATSIINVETGEMVFKVLMTSFQFEKALMQEHFNEKYVESEKYPNATFKGKIDNIDEIDLTKDGVYEVTVSGDLTIHGTKKAVTSTGTITVKEGQLMANAVFNVDVADFDIKIPGAVKDNIAKSIEITVNGTYDAYKK